LRVRFTAQAIIDLNEIASYLSARNPAAAAGVRKAIRDGTRLVAAFPYAGRQQSEPHVRKLVTRKYAYLIYYRVDISHEEIAILSIRHPARERDFADE
jgi:toxin ParE1/3/4